MLGGLPPNLRALLDHAPVEEKVLAELGVRWPGLGGAEAQMAEALRLFLVTWDPLELEPDRRVASATANADPPGLEVVVYVPLWRVQEAASEGDATVAEVLGGLAGSAVVVAARHEEAVVGGRCPTLVRKGSIDHFLSDPAAGWALGTPTFSLVSDGWEPIGLGAITDVVQDAYGPVNLDRSPVELAAVSAPAGGCPACRGRRFRFPGELGDSAPAMCPPHRAEADRVSKTRFERARASNPDGWAAVIDACSRLERPHLPNGLATKLARAGEAMFEVPEPDELAGRAQAVLEAAAWFPGRPEELAVALGAGEDMPGLPEWLANLVLDLGHAGLGAEAVAVAEAVGRIDPSSESTYAADAAVALAMAGDASAARARLEANVVRWPDDLWVYCHAGDALEILGDADGAEAQFQAALELADATDDFEARADVIERLAKLGRPPASRSTIRLVGGESPRGSPRLRRNDSCFCGSGRKYKHCHGR